MASKVFETGVRKVLAPRLAELGFERHGIRYFRPRPPWFVQGIDLQQGKYNGSGFCRFTINVARTLVPAISPARMLELAQAKKGLFHGGNWRRLGQLTEVRTDYWYDYSPEDAAGIEAALLEALADIERYGLPWLRWGLGPIGVRKDSSRAEAAEARFAAFLASLHLQAGSPGNWPKQ